MVEVDVNEAKKRLSELLARVEEGEDVVLVRAGTAVARLVPAAPLAPRQFGGLWMRIADDFDAPLPDHEQGVWT